MQTHIIEHGVVVSRPDQMYGWPSITRVKGNELLAAASERKYHVCPWGREVVMRSLDGGLTWGQPQEVYNSELDDRDANLVTMPDGTIVLTWFTSIAFCSPKRIEAMPELGPRVARVTERMREELVGAWALRSSDGGHSWEKAPHHVPAGSHAGPSLLSDGSLIFIGRTTEKDGRRSVTAHVSRDAGATWIYAGEVPCATVPCSRERLGHIPGARAADCLPYGDGKDEQLAEPLIGENHVIETQPGRLLALFRSVKTDGYLYQSVSEDSGLTWAPARATPVWGYPPHMIRLSSGPVVCTYSHRRDPYSIRAVLSYDEGDTWDVENTITLCQWTPDDPPMDFGYPVSIEVVPNEILTVYYRSRRNYERLIGPYTGTGETPEGILHTRWRLQEDR